MYNIFFVLELFLKTNLTLQIQCGLKTTFEILSLV